MTASLVDIARAALEAWTDGRSYFPPAPDLPPGPLFVTLRTRDGALRGCVGHLAPITDTLHAEVAMAVVLAASEDARFPVLGAHELDGLQIEIALVGALEAVDATALDPHRYGVVVSSGIRRGVLLPGGDGVATAEQQIALAMQNAGIGPLEPLRIERFEVALHR